MGGVFGPTFMGTSLRWLGTPFGRYATLGYSGAHERHDLDRQSRARLDAHLPRREGRPAAAGERGVAALGGDGSLPRRDVRLPRPAADARGARDAARVGAPPGGGRAAAVHLGGDGVPPPHREGEARRADPAARDRGPRRRGRCPRSRPRSPSAARRSSSTCAPARAASRSRSPRSVRAAGCGPPTSRRSPSTSRSPTACASRSPSASASSKATCSRRSPSAAASLAARSTSSSRTRPTSPRRDLPTLPAEVLGYEPGLALDGGPDGLDVARRIWDDAREWLRRGGTIALELDTNRVRHAEAEVLQWYSDVHVVRDLTGRDRFLVARVPDSRGERA